MLLAALAAGCVEPPATSSTDRGGSLATLATFTTLSEGFEAGSKPSYGAASVALASGSWRLDDALIGTTSSDVKSGARAARVRNAGKVTMEFDRGDGAGTVSVRHAVYGSDSAATWALFRSADEGASWSQVGSAVTTTSHTAATATFTIADPAPVRFEIRKLDGGADRLNIDDVAITDFDDGGGGGGGGGSGAEVSRHTALGLPAPATPTDAAAYLLVKPGFVVSYNGARKNPNWVAWELNSSYRGSVQRQSDFRVDPALPGSVPQATNADFEQSGYDRGHNCPSADRNRTTVANSETFLLTNITPQTAANNRGPWERLESYSRSLLSGGRQLFLATGGVYGASPPEIGDGVAVPEATWKVVVVLDDTAAGAGEVGDATRVIAVIMPNTDGDIPDGADWRDYRVSVDDIEAATGYDLLADVDPGVQALIEANVDDN